MLYRTLGSSGLQVSAIGLGCNNFAARMDLAATRQVVHRALDAGVTLFDTADIYGNRGGSEKFLGATLGGRRKDVVLVTKFGLPMDEEGKLKGASRQYVMQAIDASLQRLKTDWIDLYYLHRPDPATPIEETLRALDDLIRSGKVRAIGCSNFSAEQVVAADAAARNLGLRPFVSCQDQFNLLARDIERELVPAMTARGLSLLPYFPLASGLLTGKYRRGALMPQGARLANPRYSDRFLSEENWAVVERLRDFCAARGKSMLALAFAWLLAQPIVAGVIAGATTPEQMTQNIATLGWELSDAELAEIDRITDKNATAPSRPTS
jgi:aryl-alcohol dehydrogenase-like predicted oxidoreductase